MAWCPKCEGNYPIVVSINSSSTTVPVVSERYNRVGEYIGYEKGEAYTVNTESLPRCSNCYCVFDFPHATSKKEYFYAIRKFVIERWLACNPKPPEPDLGIFEWMFIIGIIVGLFVGVNAYFAIESFFAAFIIGLLAAVGLWWFGSWLDKPRRSKKMEEYKNKILKPWEEELNALQSMEYSDENYERLKRIDPKSPLVRLAIKRIFQQTKK